MHLIVLPRIGTGRPARIVFTAEERAALAALDPRSPNFRDEVLKLGRVEPGDPFRPDFKGMPEFAKHGRSWGQASSMKFGVEQATLVYVSDATEFAIEELLNRHRGGPREVARLVGRCIEDKEAARMHAHLSTRADGFEEFKAAWKELRAHHKSVKQWTPPRVAERERIMRRIRHHSARVRFFHHGASKDWLAAFREHAKREEQKELVRRSAKMLVTDRSDSFSHGGSNNINGLDMDVFAGGDADTWETLAGSANVESGNVLAFGAWVAAPSTEADVGDQRSTITPSAFDEFAAARVVDASNFYFFGGNSATARLYKKVSGSDTQLGSDGSAPNTSLACDCVGTAIRGYNNGSVDVGPVTDSAHASGRTGVGGAGFSQIFDYIGEVAGDPKPQYDWGGPFDLFTASPITPITPTKTSGNDADNFREADDSPDSLSDWGLSMDPDTGIITGTPYLPLASLPASIEVWLIPSNVDDGDGDTQVLELNLAVGAPEFTLTPDNVGNDWLHAGHGKTLVVTPTMTGGEVPNGGWTSIGTALPSGVTLNANTGALTVGPTAALGTTTGIEIQAENDTDVFSQVFKLIVLPHMPAGSYSCVPGERFDEPGYVGFCGWDPDNGPLDHVEISFDGGAPISVDAEVFDEVRGVLVWGTLFDPGDFADGPVTLDIEAFPVEGDSRVLDQITIYANDGGTLTAGRTRYVDPVNGDDGNDGLTALTAFETIDAAISDLQTTFGNCNHCTIYLADSDYTYGTGEVFTVSAGWLEIAAAPGSTPRSVRWTVDAGGFGGCHIKITDIDVYQIDLTNGAAGAAIWHYGNCVCTGLGQIDETYVFYNAGNYPDGIWAEGRPVDVSAITPGDVAAYKAAAESKFIIWQTTASFPFATQLKRNVWARETSKDTGVQYDKLVQNLIDTDIDATGSAFHADVVHLINFGGDVNLFVDNVIGTDLITAQSWFSRNGGEDPDAPDCNIAFRNNLMRGPSGANGQWMKSASNISWDYCGAPNGTLTIIDDAGTPQENHMSFVRIRRSVVNLQTLTRIGQSYEVDRNHFANATFGTNCTDGGTETDWYTDPSTDDYSLISSSDIETAAGARTCSRDVLGQPRAPSNGSIGAFAGVESSLDPPVIDYPDSPITANIRDVIDTSPTNTSELPTTWAEHSGDSLADFGLSLDPDTGRVTGTLTDIGTMSTVVRATNADGFADATLEIDISDIAPIISYGGSTIGLIVNRAATLTPVSTGGSIPASGAYALHAGSLPTGLSLNADTGVISGTPTVLETQTFTIRVTNAIGFFDRVQTLVIQLAPSDDDGGAIRSHGWRGQGMRGQSWRGQGWR